MLQTFLFEKNIFAVFICVISFCLYRHSGHGLANFYMDLY